MEGSFYFEVVAPKGLEPIKAHIELAKLGLYVYSSGFNNKGVLKNRVDSQIEIGMETSTAELMNGSGYIETSFEEAKEKMLQLNNIFKSAGLPHKIGVGDESGDNTIWYTYKYS